MTAANPAAPTVYFLKDKGVHMVLLDDYRALEAELADTTQRLEIVGHMARAKQARAEKAEAEVERLKEQAGRRHDEGECGG